MCMWSKAKGIQCPVKGSPQLHAAQQQRLGHEGLSSTSPLKTQQQEHGASPATPSDKHGWIDPIDTVEAASVWQSWRE